MNDPKPHWLQLVGMLESRGFTVIFDIGANTGQYAGYLRDAGWSGRIVSFEPQRAAHADLLSAAAGDPAWSVAPRMALGAAPGETTLHVSAESDMSSLHPFDPAFLESSPSSEVIAEETVTVETLAAVFADYAGAADRVFVKIDTQGHEAAVLDGAAAVMPRIDGIQLELSLVPLYEGEMLYREMIDRLHDLGFAAFQVVPGYFSRHMGRMLQFDGVFFRDTQEERQDP